MKKILILHFIIYTFASLIFLNASKANAQNNNIHSGEPKYELALKLIVESTTIKSGELPSCIMEVKNISNKVILISEAFSFNGPAVYDEKGNPCDHRFYITLSEDHEFKTHKIKPGESISIKATPNYQMDNPGRYTLYFGIYPRIYGYPKENDPDTMIPAGKWENPVISNKIVIEVVP